MAIRTTATPANADCTKGNKKSCVSDWSLSEPRRRPPRGAKRGGVCDRPFSCLSPFVLAGPQTSLWSPFFSSATMKGRYKVDHGLASRKKKKGRHRRREATLSTGPQKRPPTRSDTIMASTAETNVQSLPPEVVVRILRKVEANRDFGACLCASRLFWVSSVSDVLDRQCRGRVPAQVAGDPSPDALEYLRRAHGVRFDSAAVYEAASKGRDANLRWLRENTMALRRPGFVGERIACGPLIVAAAVGSGSASTLAMVLAWGYRPSDAAFRQAARLGRVDLLRMLCEAAPHGNRLCGAGDAARAGHMDAFVFILARASSPLSTLDHHVRDAVRWICDERRADFAMAVVEAAATPLLDVTAPMLSVIRDHVERTGNDGADGMNLRVRAEHAVASICSVAPYARPALLARLPTDVAVRMAGECLQHLAPRSVPAHTLMRRDVQRAAAVSKGSGDKAMALAQCLCGAETSQDILALIARWFGEGGDLAGALVVLLTVDRHGPEHILHSLYPLEAAATEALVFGMLCGGTRRMRPRAMHMSNVVRSDRVDLLRVLIADDVSLIDSRDICMAARVGSVGILRFLVERRADCAWPPALIDDAVTSGRLDVVRLVHEAAVSDATTSAMNRAASHGHIEIVRFLHAHRAEGCSAYAMSMAAAGGHAEVVRFLHEHRTEGCHARSLFGEYIDADPDIADFLLVHRPELRDSPAPLVHAACLDDLASFHRLVAERDFDDAVVRDALVWVAVRGCAFAMERIIGRFGDRDIFAPDLFLTALREGRARCAALLAEHAPDACDVSLSRTHPRSICGCAGNDCAMDRRFRRSLCARLDRKPVVALEPFD